MDLRTDVEQAERFVGDHDRGVADYRRDVAEQPRARRERDARRHRRGRRDGRDALLARFELALGRAPLLGAAIERVEDRGDTLELVGVRVLAREPLAERAPIGIGGGACRGGLAARRVGRERVDEIGDAAQPRGRRRQERGVVARPVEADVGDALADRGERRPLGVDAHLAAPELEQVAHGDALDDDQRVGRDGQHARLIVRRRLRRGDANRAAVVEQLQRLHGELAVARVRRDRRSLLRGHDVRHERAGSREQRDERARERIARGVEPAGARRRLDDRDELAPRSVEPSPRVDELGRRALRARRTRRPGTSSRRRTRRACARCRRRRRRSPRRRAPARAGSRRRTGRTRSRPRRSARRAGRGSGSDARRRRRGATAR